MSEINEESEIVLSIRLRRKEGKLFFEVLKKELTPLEERCLKDYVRRTIVEGEGLQPFEGDKYLT